MSLKECDGLIDVTIGICVKDCEGTIGDAILSLLNQSFDKRRMDIIVIDDGCKDRTIPIITGLLSKTDLKHRIFSTNCGGLTVARQMVIDKSCGNLVIFMDGDMVFSKDFIEKQVELMKKNPSVGAAQGTMKAKKSNSQLVELENLSISGAFEVGINRVWKRNPQTLGTGGTIFRVAAMKAAGGFDKRIKGSAEDADITACIKSAGYSLAVNDVEFEHVFKGTLKSLWKQYSWYGYGMHYFFHKHGKLESFLVYFWPTAYVMGLVRLVLVFKATRNKIAFFIPSYNFFRATAWWFGFFKGHLSGYGHEYRFNSLKNHE